MRSRKTRPPETRRPALWVLTLASLSLIALGVAVPLAYFPWHWLGVGLLCTGLVLGCYRLLAALRQRHKTAARVLTWLLSVGLALLLVLFGVVQAVILRGERTDPQAEGADTVIVLGAGINGTEPSLMLWYRLRTALDYMERNPDCTVIVSGGQGPDERVTEAWVMQNWLVRNGADPARIVTEERSSNTVENLLYSRALPQWRGKIVIITSDFHLTRARWIARDLGVEALGVSAPTRNGPLWANFHIREFLSVMKYLLVSRRGVLRLAEG